MNLDGLFTRTMVSFQPSLPYDELIINGHEIAGAGRDRVSYILDIIRGMADIHERAEVMTENNFPSGAGIASSASAFAALAGCIVTIDAIGTQKHIAQTIVEAQADYVLSVKENQGHLYEDIAVLFAVDQAHDFKYASLEYHQTVNKGHGRIEIRECWSTSNPAYLNLIREKEKWAGLQSIAMVVCTRLVAGKETKKIRYYISSLPSDAKRILHIVRRHWAIENELHWVLDVALNEDHSRVRKDQAPENLAVLRHIALNLLKQEKTAKGGIRAKQLQAAWKEDYLLKVLASAN